MTTLITVSNTEEMATAVREKRVRLTSTPTEIVQDCPVCGPQLRHARLAGARRGDKSPDAEAWALKLGWFGIDTSTDGLVIYECTGCHHMAFYNNPKPTEVADGE